MSAEGKDVHREAEFEEGLPNGNHGAAQCDKEVSSAQPRDFERRACRYLFFLPDLLTFAISLNFARLASRYRLLSAA